MAYVVLDTDVSSRSSRLVPEEGEEFSAHERRRFFRALANVLDVIYGEPTDGIFDADEMAKLYRSLPAGVTPAATPAVESQPGQRMPPTPADGSVPQAPSN